MEIRVQEILKAKLLLYFKQIKKRKKKIILKKENEEDIHKFRTYMRRVYSLIQEFNNYIKNSDKARFYIKEIFNYTRKLRDRDVLYLLLNEYTEQKENCEFLKIKEQILKERKKYYKKFLTFIHSKKFKKIFFKIKSEISLKEKPDSEMILYILISKYYQLFSNSYFYKELNFENLHTLRIAIKRLRYVFELFKNDLNSREFNNIINRLADLQELSGKVLDNHLMLEYLSQFQDEKIKNFFQQQLKEKIEIWNQKILEFYENKENDIEILKSLFK